MDYTTRIVRSVEGLSQEEALITLQEHPEFNNGTKIASLQDQGGRWVATLLEPKFANEDNFEKHMEDDLDDIMKHEDSDEKSESKNDEHEEHESPKEEKEEHEGGKDEKIEELEKKIDKLLDALGLSDDEKAPEGPSLDGAIPPPPAGDMVPPVPKPPAKGIGQGPELPPGSGAKLKPGEVPNKPGVTPVGSPAFASVKQAMNPPVPMSGTATPPNTPSSAAASCTKCGGAGCDQCRMGQGASGPQAPHMPGTTPATTVASFVASRLDSDRDITIRQAKISLENEFATRGFRVARIKREGHYLRALMTRNDS